MNIFTSAVFCTEMGSTHKGKNLLLGSKFFPLRVDYEQTV